MLGGFFSLAVTGYVIYMVIVQGRKMIAKDNNSYVSLYQGMDYEAVGKPLLDEMSKPLLEIL
jgi:hypothetical protein